MGCQRSIAKAIRDKGADYVLSLKGNQGTLKEDVEQFSNMRNHTLLMEGNNLVSDTRNNPMALAARWKFLPIW